MQDITHQESLIQIRDGGHCINWLLGHLISARTIPLQRVNAELVWSDDARARYRNGSAPIDADGQGVLRLEDLKTLFDMTHERLIIGLQATTDEQLRAHSGYGENTMFESFLYFHFHENLSCWADDDGRRASR